MNEMRARMGYRYAAIVRRPQHFQFCAQILRIVHGGLNVPERSCQLDQRRVIADHRICHGRGKTLQ